MNKFTKISAMVLFSLFLSACDKPATSTDAKTEAPKTEVNATSQGATDLAALLAWKAEQETALNQAQNDLQQGIVSKDQTKIASAFKAFQEKVGSVLNSLDGLNVTNADVSAFKAKIKESLVLSNELIESWVKMAGNATEEGQKAVQEKAQKLTEVGAQLQQTQIELQKKFAPQPQQ